LETAPLRGLLTGVGMSEIGFLRFAIAWWFDLSLRDDGSLRRAASGAMLDMRSIRDKTTVLSIGE